MDLVADMLHDQLQSYSQRLTVTRIRPAMRRRFDAESSATGRSHNADRLLNRFWDYARLARRISGDFDLFHIVDHSYAQLLNYLPAERAVVTCHDLDTF